MPGAGELARQDEERNIAGNNHVAPEQLQRQIERIERLEEEKQGVADDIKDVYAELKANGYDTKMVRKMVRYRKMEKHARDEEIALTNTYLEALGLL